MSRRSWTCRESGVVVQWISPKDQVSICDKSWLCVYRVYTEWKPGLKRNMLAPPYSVLELNLSFLSRFIILEMGTMMFLLKNLSFLYFLNFFYFLYFLYFLYFFFFLKWEISKSSNFNIFFFFILSLKFQGLYVYV